MPEPIHGPSGWGKSCTCGRWFGSYPSAWAVAEAMSRHALQEHR